MSEEKRESQQGKTERQEAKVHIDVGLGGIFQGIGSLIDLVSQVAETSATAAERASEFKVKFEDASGEAGTQSQESRGVYGFTVRTDIGGTPHVESFGNLRETEEGPAVVETREPVVDLFDEDAQIVPMLNFGAGGA